MTGWGLIPSWVAADAAAIATIAGAVVTLSAAWLLIPRLFGWLESRRRNEMRTAARVATDELLATLMKPNSGKSLADIAAAVNLVAADTRETAVEVRGLTDRVARVERQIDGTLMPRQLAIQTGIDNLNVTQRGNSE